MPRPGLAGLSLLSPGSPVPSEWPPAPPSEPPPLSPWQWLHGMNMEEVNGIVKYL